MISSIVAAAAPIIGELVDRVFPDSTERELKRLEYTAKLQETLNQLDIAQIELNKAEAASASVFVAGWRPFIGWVCGGAFAYNLIVQPFLQFLLSAFGHAPTALPELDSDLLGWAMGGMLGLGTMRTVEKVKGVTTGLAGAVNLPWMKK